MILKRKKFLSRYCTRHDLALDRELAARDLAVKSLQHAKQNPVAKRFG
jgi:hypothetical protein